ncbi:amino acid adenylation domain-containing protein [Eleftheria terrae]|uniref:non-ribosomal peptide synthetase n=1 Tax=Eleftheria terrae TaxID=1597781 RepID=UPI003F4E37A8
MLQLTQADIDRIVASVPGGAANVQDIYPLAPLQEGILFHHRMAPGDDPYLLQVFYSFDSRDRLDAYLQALQAVLDRHDILRSAVLWQGLPEPVQVVWRQATLPVQALAADPGRDDDPVVQLQAALQDGRLSIELRRAPLLGAWFMPDRRQGRWVMSLVFHHLVLDHAALDLVQDEVHALLDGRGAQLPTPTPYREFVAHSRRGRRSADDEAFFTGMLGDISEPTAPFDTAERAASHADAAASREATVLLDAALAGRLREQARAHGVSTASVCHLAWALVLASVCGRQDVVFGTLLFGRLQGGDRAGRGLGLFINTLPLRVTVGEDSVRDGVRRVHQLLAQLLRHEHAPLVQAQRCSGVAAPAPLFTALLNYRHNVDAGSQAARAQMPRGVELLGAQERTHYPCCMNVDDLGTGFRLTAQVRPSIDAERVCAFMVTALSRLVDALERAPSTPCRRVPALPESERQQLLQGWNRTEAPYPRQASLPSLVEAHAVARPDAPAVVHGERQLSYAQLNAQANQLAHGLVQRGVRPGARVAVLLERSIEMVVAQLAVLKAGAAFVTLDRHAPQARQRYIVQDCGAQLLLCEAGLELPEVEGVQQLVLARLAAELAQQPQEDLGLAVDAESVAHITYTSGSTGQPKGVMVPHRAIARVALNNGWAELGEGDRFGYISNPAWDANTLELWVPLLNGACVVAIEQREVLDPEAFKRRLLQQEVNVLWLTVGLFNQYAQALGEVFRRLRYLLVGGDALDARVVAQVLRDSPPQHLVNGYGPTETTVFATTWEIRELDAQARGVPIGRPIANTSIYLLDGQGEPVPVGATGEICIGGDGVTLGYLNQPELTAERFVRDPFSSRPGARMYKSGDLGRWRADGVLEFVGRNDHQVKIRGFRIELGEIEARLVQHPGVREAVVLVRQDEPGAKRLVAYVIPAGEAVPEAEALRSHLSQQLPEYMVPAAYVVLQQLPLTINGKLDRQALPVPEAGAYASRRYEAPQGEVEATLARLWCELLKVERVGRQDNFFELGGHSLLAVTLIERMRQAGLALDVRLLFATPTLAALARQVNMAPVEVEVPANLIPPGCRAIEPEMLTLVALSREEIEQVEAGVPGGAANIQDIYPLAPLQEGILFHHLMAESGDVYVTPALFAFDSRERLQGYLQALQAVIDRHDILRTSLCWEGLSEPVQVVWRQAPLVVQELQLDAAQGDAAGQLQARLAGGQLVLPLQQAPLMRVAVAEDRAQGRWLALQLFHHVAIDHTTLEILLQEIQAHLQGQAQGLPRPLPFRDFVAQARLAVSRQEHQAFFSEMLGAVEEATLPYGLSDVQGQGRAIVQSQRQVPGRLAQRLRANARALGVSVASLCHLAYGQVLARVCQREEVVFGTVLFGRMQGGAGADRALGLFLNTLPLKLQVGEVGVQEAVRQTQRWLARLLRHEHAPLALAQRCSRVPASLPLFSALLNYRHDSAAGPEAEGDAAMVWDGIELLQAQERTNYPLTLSVDDLGDLFRLTVQVDAAVDAQALCAMVEQALCSLVEALEDAPQTPVGQLEVMPEVERQLVLQGWNQTAQRVPEDLCLHELVEVQAARQPAAVAVVHGERRLSYGELNEQANRLAHELRRLGVKPDERVGLCCERGLELAVGLLAVLKAGGAYVPLDPAYPKERLQYMLQDSAPVVVLVQGVGRERIDAQVPVLDLQNASGWSAQPSTNPSRSAIGLQPSHLAYVIYTSGSTGQPKGVAIEHRNAVNFLSWAAEAFDAEQLKHTLWATSVNFDLAVYEYFAPLSVGTTVEVVGNALEAAQATGEVTLINTVPSALQALLESDQVPASVKTVNLAGEALKRSLVEALFERTGVEQVCNLYGPSETTTYSTWVEMKREDGFAPHIGRPIANTQIYLLDAQGRPVPMGVPGEIHIGGAGVARGYLNRPELTAERFLKDPFASDPQARMYKTGDLGRWLADGQLEYLGRNDHQVKIRGFRIELGEIEARLAQHAGVREAVVLAREDQPGDKRLVAYVTAQPGAALEAEALRGELSQQLPEYMVPVAYVVLEQLPLTPNGKLDRQALPAPEGEAYAARRYEAPQGEVEATLARLWCELLKVQRVGRHDNFFELGGHSLLAVTLIERMRQAGLPLDVRSLFASPTLATLAASVGGPAAAVEVPPNRIPPDCQAIEPQMLSLVSLDEEAIGRVVAQVPGGAANIQDIYPLAPLQEGILFHHLMAEAGDPYLMHVTYRLDSQDRLDSFLLALQRVIDRHDVLRTAFCWEAVTPAVQVVWRRAALPVHQMVCRPGDGSPLQQLHERFDPRRRPLDLRQAPLLDACIAEEAAGGGWLLMLRFHHLVLDHTSLEVLLEEVKAGQLGAAASLPSPAPFRNHVAQALGGVSQAEHEAFFSRMLGDLAEPTLPFGLLDVQRSGTGVAEAHRALPTALARRLRRRARALGVSVASACHLAFAMVLARVCGRQDVVFGTVLFGRMRGGEGVERALGLFLNTLPLRLQLEQAGARQALASTHRALAQLLRHEHAPLALAQRCSAVAAPAPLFSALLNYRHAGAAAPAGDHESGWPGVEGVDGQERTNYPLLLSVDDLGEELALSAQVLAVVDPQRVCGMMEQALRSLVEALEDAPQTPVGQLEVMPEVERQLVLQGWNQTALWVPEDLCLHELVEVQAARQPAAVAVVHGERRLSYGELNEQANRLAHELRRLGVKPDERVGLCCERGLELAVGLLAVLKAGGAYVPLDPAYPKERLQYMLQDSAPVVVLVQGLGRERIDAQVPVLDLQNASGWSAQPSTNPSRSAIGLQPSHLAYVIYTSGSTGQPKGVAIEHRNAVNFLSWAAEAFDAEQLKHTLWATSVNFDLAVYEYFAPLSVGTTVEVVGNALEAGQATGEVTLINTVPSALQALLESDQVPASVKTVNLAGEALKRSLVEVLFERTGVEQVCNLYGPSETTTYSTWVEMKREDGFAPHIGRPIANTKIYLLDSQGRPVPVGVPGEIHIGGAGVARGYLNRPELTAERFLKDPFASDPQARMYKTGDLGRWLADGNLEYLGRNDHQVKIRGFRIELGEIEARLAQHAGVREAVVLAREDQPGEKRLVAYLTPQPEATLQAEALRHHLAQQLPEYMVPAAYVVLEQLPLTPNGKLDRHALPAPEGEAYAACHYEAPQGEVERTLAGLWAELLKVERVGRHDNFFELGGHSLLAVTLIERMRQAGLPLDVRSLFATPTLAALAASAGGAAAVVEVPPNRIPPGCQAIEPEMLTLVQLTREQIGQVVATVPGGATNIQDIYPLAPLQEGLLFHHLLEREGDVYLTPALLRFDDHERLDGYLRALQAVVDRHDILRTAVLWEGLPEPVQVVWRQAPLAVELIELDPAEGDPASQLQERFDPRRSRIDVRQAPLMRLYVAPDTQGRWLLMQLFHHLAIDHTALGMVQAEIQAQLLHGDQAVAGPRPLPFRDFVVQARQGVPLAEHEAFFREMLADVTEPTTPFGLADVQGDGRQVVEARQALDTQLAARLRAWARALGVTPASLCHLAFAQVLARLSGRRTVVFGTVLFGRMRGDAGTDRALGVFMNTLPLRMDVDDLPVQDGVLATQRRLAGLLRHEHAPLALAQRCSGVQAPTPLFSALLNFRHSPRSTQEVDEQSMQAWSGIEFLGGEERTNYPLSLSVDDHGEGFGLTAQVDSGVSAARVCEYMETALRSLVQALETAPETPLWQLEVMPQAERQQVLQGWNASARAQPPERCIHELIEAQARATPEAVAVEQGGARLSYAQLNAEANRLARYLRQRGVQPDSRVAVCLPRGPQLVVAWLAVWKAGGAYVPLDAAYPRERLAYLVQDSAPVLVLTDAERRTALEGGAAAVVDLQQAAPEWAGEPAQELAPDGLQARHLAYVIYTSGSTGQPKGVMVEHRQLGQLVAWHNEAFGVEAGQRTSSVAGLGFDAAAWEVWPALCAGATLVLAPQAVAQDVAGLLRWWQAETLAVSFLPTPIAELALAGGQVPQGLRVLLVGGDRLRQRAPAGAGYTLVNNYGPTEATVVATSGPVGAQGVLAPAVGAPTEAGAPTQAGVITIGRPIGHTRIYLLDEQGRPVPIGVAGELYIGGPSVARGYLGRQALTAERFVRDPFAEDAQARMYRTGDLARWLADGQLEFLGRNDQQLKIRGLRIEPGEIEAQLALHPEVREAVVLAREERLVAYVTPAGGQAPQAEALRRHLAQRLPEYMVPAAYMVLPQLPLTPNGKLDRDALPAPDAPADAAARYEAPVGETETALALTWSELLRVDRVGRHDNFFALGGHSLLATKLVVRLRSEMGVDIAMHRLFSTPTLASLAEVILDAQLAQFSSDDIEALERLL